MGALENFDAALASIPLPTVRPDPVTLKSAIQPAVQVPLPRRRPATELFDENLNAAGAVQPVPSPSPVAPPVATAAPELPSDQPSVGATLPPTQAEVDLGAAGPASPVSASQRFDELLKPKVSSQDPNQATAYENVKAGFQAGKQNVSEAWNVGMPVVKAQLAALGIGSSDDAELANAIAPIRAEAKLRAATGVKPASGWTLANVEQTLGGALPSLAVVGGAAAAGSMVAPGVGTIAGLVGSSAWLTNASAFADYLEMKGIDTSNPVAIQAAFAANPDLKTQAAAYAGAKSGISGAINGVAGKLGGVVSDRFLSAGANLERSLSGDALRGAQQAGTKASLGAKVVGTAADVGVGSAAGGVQEAANQLQDTGKLDFNKIAQQTVLGAATYAPLVALSGAKIAAKSVGRGLVKASRTAFGGEAPVQHTVVENGVEKLNPEVYPLTNDQNDLASIDIANKVLVNFRDMQRGKVNPLAHAGMRAGDWYTRIAASVDAATKNTQAGKNFFKWFSSIDPTAVLRPEHVLETLAQARIIVTEVPNANNVNLKPDLHISTPGPRPDLVLKISASSEKSTGKTALTIDDASRPFYPSEALRLIEYAQENGFDYVSWHDQGGPSSAAFGQSLNDNFKNAKASALTRALAAPGTADVVHRIADVTKIFRPTFTDYWAQITPRQPPEYRPGGKTKLSEVALGFKNTPEELKPVFEQLSNIVQGIARGIGLSKPLKIIDTSHTGTGNLGQAGGDKSAFTLDLNLAEHSSIPHAYSTAIHELGHIIVFDKFRSADPRILLKILDDYHQWRDDLAATQAQGSTFEQQLMSRDTLMDVLAYRGTDVSTNFNKFSARDAKNYEYWHSFEEYLAQQIAKWGQTSLRPLSQVDKYFAGLGKVIFNTMRRATKLLGFKTSPEAVMQDWLNSLARNIRPEAFASIYQKIAIQSMLANHQAMKNMGAEEVDAVPNTESTAAMRLMKLKIFSGQDTARWKRLPAPTDGNGNPLPPDKGGWVPKSGGVEKNYDGMMAFADKMNRFYMNTLGIHQAAAMNPHVRELVIYKDLLQQAEKEGTNYLSERMKTLRRWPKGKEQNQALIEALDEMGQMRYRDPHEIQNNVRRHPTPQERDALAAKLTPETREVFEQILKDYDGHLDKMADVLRGQVKAGKAGLVEQARRLSNIDVMVEKMREAPYVPQVRFGRYTIRVLDKGTSTMRAFLTAESKAERRRAVAELEKQYTPALFDIKQGILAEDAIPLLGMPPDFLKMIDEKLKLSSSQKAAVRDLQYEMSPAQSFKHRLQKKDNVPGYSQDAKRAYADYFVHGTNFLKRVKYRDQLQSLIASVFDQAQIPDFGDKRMQIHNMMSRHYADWVDPKPDFWRLKAAAFFIHLGFNPASAVINLTQIPLQTVPFLARGFSTPLALRYVTKASTRLASYYREAKLENVTDDYMAMLNEGVKDGWLTEALAPEIAGIAEGRNLTERYLGNSAQRGVAWFMHHSATMFQMAEKMNRRVTAGAAYELAKDYPGSKMVREALEANPEQFSRLIEQGFHPREARAITAAKFAVENTQGVYARWARPAMFRGKKGALFLFKSFQQNLLFSVWNYPAAGVKTALAMAFLGGAMGIPGMGDASDIIKAIGGELEKDWDVERHARELVTDFSDGTIPPDILLHGVSKYGFGIPAILDLASHTANLGDVPFPTVDMSGSVGFGNISPVQLAPLFFNNQDPNAALGQATTQASGAAFSLGFAMYKVLTDPTNARAWSQLVPRSAYNLWRAYNASQDQLTNASGARVVKFDPYDTRQMMEILGIGMGFMPLRLTAEWDRERAVKEVVTFWNLRREGLLRQYSAAVIGADSEERSRVIAAIRQFNSQLPAAAGAKKIDSNAIKTSVTARVKSVKAQEQQRAISKSDIGLVRNVNKLYPEAKDVVASQKLAPSKAIVK